MTDRLHDIQVLKFTDQDKLAALQREVAMRKRVYPRWVESGRMTKAKAEREIAVMEAIAADYRKNTDLFAKEGIAG